MSDKVSFAVFASGIACYVAIPAMLIVTGPFPGAAGLMVGMYLLGALLMWLGRAKANEPPVGRT